MYCIWQGVKTPTIIPNNPVYCCITSATPPQKKKLTSYYQRHFLLRFFQVTVFGYFLQISLNISHWNFCRNRPFKCHSTRVDPKFWINPCILFYLLNRYVRISFVSFKAQSVLCYGRRTDEDSTEPALLGGWGGTDIHSIKLVVSFSFCFILLTNDNTLNSSYQTLIKRL